MKSYLKLNNRSTNDICREFNLFLMKITAVHNSEMPDAKRLLFKSLAGDKQGFINWLNQDIETIAAELAEADQKEEERIKRIKRNQKKKV